MRHLFNEDKFVELMNESEKANYEDDPDKVLKRWNEWMNFIDSEIIRNMTDKKWKNNFASLRQRRERQLNNDKKATKTITIKEAQEVVCIGDVMTMIDEIEDMDFWLCVLDQINAIARGWGA